MSESMTPEQEVAVLIERASVAQEAIADYSQDQVDELIRAMVYAVAREDRAEEIAHFTVEETQLGNYEGKYLKIHRKTRATLMDIIDDKSVGVIEELPERNIVKIAKPVGVIGAPLVDPAGFDAVERRLVGNCGHRARGYRPATPTRRCVLGALR